MGARGAGGERNQARRKRPMEQVRALFRGRLAERCKERREVQILPLDAPAVRQDGRGPGQSLKPHRRLSLKTRDWRNPQEAASGVEQASA